MSVHVFQILAGSVQSRKRGIVYNLGLRVNIVIATTQTQPDDTVCGVDSSDAERKLRKSVLP